MSFKGLVIVRYQGRLGNRLAQYCFGRIVARALEFELLASPALPGFPGTSTGADLAWPDDPPAAIQILRGHRLDLGAVLADRSPRVVLLDGMFLRYEYFRAHKELIRRSWLPDDPPAPEPYDLTIHVRCGDVWRKGTRGWVHPEYHTLPFSFYDDLVAQEKPGRILVITDDPGDPMVGKLQARFGAAVQSSTLVEDFRRLRASRKLVLSVSTYAWWAGWLSNAAKIFFPVAGLFDQDRSRRREPHMQQDLWVSDEARYRAVRPRRTVEEWTGTEELRRQLLES